MSIIAPPPDRPRPSAIQEDRLLETLPTAVLAVDQQGRIRYVNATAAEMLAGANGLMGRRLADVVGPQSPLLDLVRRAADQQQKVVQARLSLGAGVLAQAGAQVAAVAAPAQQEGLVSLVLSPVARPSGGGGPPRAARALAHEVRNPLAGIRAAAQLLSRSGGEDVSMLAGLICDEVDRIRRLTDRIDPFANLGPQDFSALNVHEALDRVARILASGWPSVRLVERYDPSLPHIQGDLDQLIQALLNIAKNAVEAVDGLAAPEVRLSTAYRPGLRLRRGPGGAGRPLLEIAVEDNGPGLPPHIQEELFKPFVSAKAGGMGLGLAIAAEVVARHDGLIEVDSAPGRTVFRVLLPCGAEKGVS